ncbi:perilipin-2 isoform X1 [Eublepharis macularius]|uniref:Perilipin n=1 Tax=Eublepharis macularius TaxID=481883 RepID=A0AA97JPT0_EUBMA|nr:perilipin-2 isoform X1 [Eublepharis macularius]XP_054842259.1 perilipin-2 isoform X1 [Eublepharis macularius]XP_054842260.1 perilipin-2 isoform X1 [Eublepharis macularius]
MAVVSTDAQQNVVSRVANLPLVSSTYDMVSSAYITTKDNHPYLKSVCEIAEKGVKTITAVAMTSALPIIQRLEPQIAVANSYACIGLDKVEERLPILYQPTDKVVANAVDVVVGAKEAVTTTVTGAKDTVAHTINGVVDKTKGAVQDSVEMTKSVVHGSINTVLGSRVVRLVTSGVDTALSRSETLVDQYLPLTEEEQEKEATNMEGFDAGVQKPSYYVRLGSLSSKVRSRAYQQALITVRDAKVRSQETISHLNYTVNLIEYARKNMNNANQKLQDAQQKLYNSLVEWRKNIGHTGDYGDNDTHSAENIESRTLAIARSLTQQLQTTCLTLVSSIQGLPQNIQDQVHHVGALAGEVYRSFRSASSFREVSDNIITSSKGQLKKMKESLDDVMDYLVNNTPLNWLVPDFTITDLSSESDEIPDVLALDEEPQPDYSRANGPIASDQIAE